MRIFFFSYIMDYMVTEMLLDRNADIYTLLVTMLVTKGRGRGRYGRDMEALSDLLF